MKAFDKLGKGLKAGCAPCALRPRVRKVSGIAEEMAAIPTTLEEAKKMYDSATPEQKAWVDQKVKEEESKPKIGFIDLLLGPLAWGSKAVEAKAKEAGSETAKEVADTARAVRFGTYAAATIGTLGAIGYVVRSFK